MEFRHEFKHILNYSDYFLLRGRLRHIMPPDPHAGPDGCYLKSAASTLTTGGTMPCGKSCTASAAGKNSVSDSTTMTSP